MRFVRFVVFGFLALCVIYLAISIYSRSVRRERLEKQWDAERPEGITREAFVAEGMAHYESGLRKKLILLVFVIPPIVVGVLYYLIN